jgi:hypothetical protein
MPTRLFEADLKKGEIKMKHLNGLTHKVEFINNSRILLTSVELMCELHEKLDDFPFVEHLAITVRRSRENRSTFSLIYFWNPDRIGMGYVKLIDDQPLAKIREHISVIKNHGSLAGYFDFLQASIAIASTTNFQKD